MTDNLNDYRSILQSIDNKEFAPIYFLMGDEPFFIDQISKRIGRSALKEEEKAFNESVLYGKETTIQQVIMNARQVPMMAERKVVFVKEAQNLSRSIDDLSDYAESPIASTILVMEYKYKTLDKRKKAYKSLLKSGVIFISKKLYDSQLLGWVSSFFSEQGKKITPKSSALLMESVGNDLTRMSKELEKLFLSEPDAETITEEMIQNHIGISKEYNNFELQKAILNRNVKQSNQIILQFSKNPNAHPIVVTLSVLYHFFSKLIQYHTLSNKSEQSVANALKINPFFVKDYEFGTRNFSLKKAVQILSYLKETDRKSKGVDVQHISDFELLRELVFKIIH